jgi:hypothetical protein
MLIHDLDVRIIHAATGELLRELTLDPTKDYQPRCSHCRCTRRHTRLIHTNVTGRSPAGKSRT